MFGYMYNGNEINTHSLLLWLEEKHEVKEIIHYDTFLLFFVFFEPHYCCSKKNKKIKKLFSMTRFFGSLCFL